MKLFNITCIKCGAQVESESLNKKYCGICEWWLEVILLLEFMKTDMPTRFQNIRLQEHPGKTTQGEETGEVVYVLYEGEKLTPLGASDEYIIIPNRFLSEIKSLLS